MVRLITGDQRPSWIESCYLYSAKSGLIESSCLRFLSLLLRRHGFDPITLKSRIGDSLSEASWTCGDLVAMCSNKSRDLSLNMIGRVCDPLKSNFMANNGQSIQVPSSKVTVEFLDSSAWRNSGVTNAAAQRISSGVISSLPINAFNPASLVYAGLNVGLFRSQYAKAELSDGSYASKSDFDSSKPLSTKVAPSVKSVLGFIALEEVEVEPSESKLNVSLSSKIAALEKLESSAITSIRTMVRDDSSLITKLCSQGLLDAILNALDKILYLFTGILNDKRNPRKVDVHILRALLHIVFMICEKIYDTKKSRSYGHECLNFEVTSTSTLDTTAGHPSSLRMCIRGLGRSLVNQTSSVSQDMMRITSFIERGLLCNDEKWVSKALNTSYQRSTSNSPSNAKLLHDEDGDSLLKLAVSFGCSTNILKCLIKASCIVTNQDIKIAALSNQADALQLLLRYSSYDDGTLDLASCAEDIRDILDKAVQRQEREGSYLADVGHSFSSNAVTKMLHLLYAVHDSSRETDSSSYFHDIAKLLEGALFGNISSSEETFHVRILGDSSISSRQVKDKAGNQASNRSTFFQLLPEVLVTEAILRKPDPKILSESVSPLHYCLNLLEALLCTKDRNENYAGYVLASFIFQSTIDIPRVELDLYGLHELFLIHENRLTNACKIESDHKSNRDATRCPQGHEAFFHITDKNSFRCDLCDRAIKIGKGLHGCRICDWDVCELCLKCDENEADTTKMKSMVTNCCRVFLERYSGSNSDLHEDGDLTRIARGIREMDRDSLRNLSALLNSRGQVPLYSFVKTLLPAIYSSVLICIQSRNHAPTAMESFASFVRRRKKARTESTTGCDASKDFVQMVIEELILPTFQKGNVSLSPISDLLSDNNEMDEEESNDEEPHAHKRLSMPPFLRKIHQILALYEDFNVEKFAYSKQCELESLSTPLTLELCLSEGSENGVHSLIAEPTVSISDVHKYIVKKFPSFENKYLNFCRR